MKTYAHFYTYFIAPVISQLKNANIQQEVSEWINAAVSIATQNKNYPFWAVTVHGGKFFSALILFNFYPQVPYKLGTITISI